MKYTLLLFCLLTCILSCKNDNAGNESSAPTEGNDTKVIELDKDFVDFYNKFHTDTIFQLSVINFPLQAEGDSITWTKENWIAHKPFNDFGGKFRREFTPAGKIMLERIYDANGFFTMNRRWAELSDGWRLMYYKIDLNEQEQ